MDIDSLMSVRFTRPKDLTFFLTDLIINMIDSARLQWQKDLSHNKQPRVHSSANFQKFDQVWGVKVDVLCIRVGTSIIWRQ
jgi:hypothetical protein